MILTTDNMTLVAFLETQRVRADRTWVADSGQVMWEYERDPARLQELALAFNGRRATVEPTLFHRALTKVRREMNAALRVDR